MAATPGLRPRTLWLLCVLVFCGWLSTGIYKVQPDEQGVVLHLGKWVGTQGPGLHFHYPYPIDTVLLPKVTKINQLQLGKGFSGTANQMLTGDENIVEVDCAVSWRIKDAGHYLFKVYDPEGTLLVAAESALREVISRNPIQAALADKRQQIGEEAQQLLQSRLDSYQAGIEITQVQLQRIDPPGAVIDAFNDVQRARADQERSRNEAEAYRNEILPRARGEATRIIEEANAYKTQVVGLADGEARSFTALNDSFKLAPEVTAWRLYMESLDEVLRRSTRIIVDSSGKGVSGVVPYLPLTDAPRPVPPNQPVYQPPAQRPVPQPPAQYPGQAVPQ